MRTSKGKQYCFGIFLFVCLSFFLGGCGAKPNVQEMALSPDDEAIDIQGSHIMLLSLKTDNQYKPEWPPEVVGLEIVDDSTQEKIEIAVQSMEMSSLIKRSMKDTFTLNKGTSSWEGLISFHLPPGNYHLEKVRAVCIRGIGVAAAISNFEFFFDTPFKVDQEQLSYLGRIEITIIGENDSDAGVDIVIKDNYDQDIKQFMEEYPALNGQKITKKILPPWAPPKPQA